MQSLDMNNILLKTICPNNELIADQTGNPSVMVYIPKFRMNHVIGGGSDKVHPAFIVNGKEIDGFYISKYQNINVDGRGYSLPGMIPSNDAGFAVSMEKCVSKGPGWHLTTVQEWGAIALWCKKNGHLPHGNTDYGKDRRESMYKAIPVTSVDGGVGQLLGGVGPIPFNPDTTVVHTGTGPVAWSHDNTIGGIWDLVGNLSEWVGGFRTVYGEIQVMPNNDGADLNNSQAPDSSAWRAIDAATGEYIVPNGNGTTQGSVKVDWYEDVVVWGSKWFITTEVKNRKNEVRRCDLSFVQCDESISPEAKELLFAFGLIADDPAYDYMDQYCYLNNGLPEGTMYRGGYFGSGSFAGVFCWSNSFERTYTSVNHSFRASYVPL